MRENTPTARLDKTPTYAPCEMCGAPDGVAYHHPEGSTDYYCPRCAQRHALYSAAYDQLEAQVRNAVEAWLSIWGNLPGVIDLEEHLGQIAAKLSNEYQMEEQS